jgi:hypothetical protein
MKKQEFFKRKLRGGRKNMSNTIEIIENNDGIKIVRINGIHFKGKRGIDWKAVRNYLKAYVGEIYETADEDIIYVGTDFPAEYSGSRYTRKLKGAVAKAKANASQGIQEMIKIANNKRHVENNDARHVRNARYGWYRYDTRFELPVFSEEGDIERYNLFRATILIRHASNGNLYLYDIVDIKKETSNSLGS